MVAAGEEEKAWGGVGSAVVLDHLNLQNTIFIFWEKGPKTKSDLSWHHSVEGGGVRIEGTSKKPFFYRVFVQFLPNP